VCGLLLISGHQFEQNRRNDLVMIEEKHENDKVSIKLKCSYGPTCGKIVYFIVGGLYSESGAWPEIKEIRPGNAKGGNGHFVLNRDIPSIT